MIEMGLKEVVGGRRGGGRKREKKWRFEEKVFYRERGQRDTSMTFYKLPNFSYISDFSFYIHNLKYL